MILHEVNTVHPCSGHHPLCFEFHTQRNDKSLNLSVVLGYCAGYALVERHADAVQRLQVRPHTVRTDTSALRHVEDQVIVCLLDIDGVVRTVAEKPPDHENTHGIA